MGYAELAVSGLITTSWVGLGIYLLKSSPQADQLGDLSKLTYFFGYMKGNIHGVHTPEMTQFAFREDIRRLRNSMHVVVADPDFIDNGILDALVSRLKEVEVKHDKVKPSFIIGPNTKSQRLQQLAEQGTISLQELVLDPRANVRVVDDNYTFVSGGGRYSWTFGNRRAVDDRIRMIIGLEAERREEERFKELARYLVLES